MKLLLSSVIYKRGEMFNVFFIADSLDSEKSIVESVASIRPSPSPTKASDSLQGSIASIPKLTDIFQNR